LLKLGDLILSFTRKIIDSKRALMISFFLVEKLIPEIPPLTLLFQNGA
jgi:hypothetical protein